MKINGIEQICYDELESLVSKALNEYSHLPVIKDTNIEVRFGCSEYFTETDTTIGKIIVDIFNSISLDKIPFDSYTFNLNTIEGILHVEIVS